MIGFMVSSMDDKKIVNEPIPYIVFESTNCRFERVIKRLWITILILIFLLLGTNLAWLYHESQFEEVTETTTVEQKANGESNNSFIGGDNNVGDTENNDSQKEKA